jgi:hypothetical protein
VWVTGSWLSSKFLFCSHKPEFLPRNSNGDEQFPFGDKILDLTTKLGLKTELKFILEEILDPSL